MLDGFWPQLDYHAKQAEYWACKAKWIYLCVGRQGGKTELALRKLVRHLPVKKDWPDPRYFYCGPTFGQAKRTAWERLLNLVPDNWKADVSVTDLSIKTIFGSELFLFGLDKPQRIEGSILDGGVIDENSDIKPGTFDLSILPTLVWRDGWTDFIGIPKRFGVGAVEYREKYEKAARGEIANAAAFTWPSEGVVPDDFLNMCRESMDDRDFDEQFNASWLSAAGGIFHAFDRDYNVRPCAYDPAQPIIVGMDFNVDPMAWVLCHDKGGTLECFDEIWLRSTNTIAALMTLTSKYDTHTSGWLLYGDASSRASHTSAYSSDFTQIAQDELLVGMGRTLHFDTSNPPKADRFASTNARICNGNGLRRLFVDSSCPRLIRDLETRSYKLGTRDTDDTGDRGHMTDALGYIVHKKWPLQLAIQNSNVVTISKGVH